MDIIPNNFVFKLQDVNNGYDITYSTPFPSRYTDNIQSVEIDGNVIGLDTDRFSILVPSITSVNFTNGKKYYEVLEMVHVPATLDEDVFDSDQFTLSLPQVLPTNAQYKIYVKTDSNTGSVIGVKVQDYVVIGTGFINENDPTWKHIVTISTQEYSGTYGNYSCPILYMTNSLSGYSYLVEFVSTQAGGVHLRITDLDYAQDFNLVAISHFYQATPVNRVFAMVNEGTLLYLAQIKENKLNASLYNNAKFVIR